MKKLSHFLIRWFQFPSFFVLPIKPGWITFWEAWFGYIKWWRIIRMLRWRSILPQPCTPSQHWPFLCHLLFFFYLWSHCFSLFFSFSSSLSLSLIFFIQFSPCWSIRPWTSSRGNISLPLGRYRLYGRTAMVRTCTDRYGRFSLRPILLLFSTSQPLQPWTTLLIFLSSSQHSPSSLTMWNKSSLEGSISTYRAKYREMLFLPL